MVLTREFRETFGDRARGDAEFRAALLSEAAEALLGGDAEAARLLLRDFINATIGFEMLAQRTGIPAKSLHRMFGRNGNPGLSNLARVLRVLEQGEGLRLSVSATPSDRIAES